MRHETITTNTHRRRGVTVVLVAVLIPVLLGAAALTIDVGLLINTRADLQIAADASALAGVAALGSDEMMSLRMYPEKTAALGDVQAMTTRLAATISSHNMILSAQAAYIEPHDITVGWIDMESGTSPIRTDVPPSQFNAVQTIVRRSKKSRNGPVELLFAKIFGFSTANVTATATAVFDDRAAGFSPAGGPALWPFSIHEDVLNEDLRNGGDSFSYDKDTGALSPVPDGVREINLFPLKSEPGNFGALNIGIENQSASGFNLQIEEGITPEQMEVEVGTPEMTFYDEDGHPITYVINGNTGISSSMEASIRPHVGRLIGFFVHTDSDLSGSSAVFTVHRMFFGRLMAIDLSGGEKGIWIQPESIVSPSVITSETAPSSGGLLVRIMLAR